MARLVPAVKSLLQLLLIPSSHTGFCPEISDIRAGCGLLVTFQTPNLLKVSSLTGFCRENPDIRAGASWGRMRPAANFSNTQKFQQNTQKSQKMARKWLFYRPTGFLLLFCPIGVP
jgi:hypothetical protein